MVDPSSIFVTHNPVICRIVCHIISDETDVQAYPLSDIA